MTLAVTMPVINQRTVAPTAIDFLTGCLVAAVLTIVNIVFGFPGGETTYIPYDPVGALVVGQGLSQHLGELLAASVTMTSGLWAALIGLVLRVMGDGFWQLNVMLFWHSVALLSLVCWVGRRFAGATGALCLVVATAMLPPMSFMVIGTARHWLFGTMLQNLLWPGFVQEVVWDSWGNNVLKPDLLAGTLVAWAVALIVIDPADVSKKRFIASGACMALAVLAKGHFFLVYLAGWGTALFVTAVMMKETGSFYVGRSYWALLIMAPIMVTWARAGGAQGAFDYIHSSNPLKNSPGYQRPDLGVWFFVELAPSALGLGVQIALAFVIVTYALNGNKIKDALVAVAPALSASLVMALPVVTNPYGKNFSMILPIFVIIWLSLAILVGKSFPLLRKQLGQWVVPIWLAPFTVIAVLGVWAHYRTLSDRSGHAALAADRAALSEVATALLSVHPHSVISPLTNTGFPAILSYELTRKARGLDIAVPRVFNVYWDEHNLRSELQNRQIIRSSDAVVWIPGGPERFPFLGEYQSHAYRIVGEVLMGKDSPFRLIASIDIGPESLATAYFDNHDQAMRVEVYAKK